MTRFCPLDLRCESVSVHVTSAVFNSDGSEIVASYSDKIYFC